MPRDGSLFDTIDSREALPAPLTAWIAQSGSQRLFLSCPIREILYEGTRGPGKTDAMFMKFAKYTGRGYGSAWRGLIFRETYKQLQDIIVKSQRWFYACFPGITYNAGDFSWRWPTGEVLMFRHMAKPSDYWNYHGHEYPFIGWEELTNWMTLECYDMMKACNRSSFPNMPRVYASTANPYGKGHNAVKRRFITPAARGRVIYDEFSPSGRVALHGDITENKILLANDPDYLAQLDAIQEPNRKKAWRFGSWDITSGGMLDDLWDERIHVLEPFKIPKEWRIDRGFDWGSARPAGLQWFAESNGEEFRDNHGKRRWYPKGTIFVIGEIYTWTGEENVGSRRLSKDIAREAFEIEQRMGWRVRPGPADSAIFNDEDGPSIADKMAEEGITFIPCVKGPGSRVNGWEVFRNRLQAAIQRPMEAPGYFVFNTCRQTIRTVSTLPRDEKNPEDVDTESEDHLGDVSRYRLTTPIQSVQTSSMRG